jgi:DNA mismatch repair protein MutS
MTEAGLDQKDSPMMLQWRSCKEMAKDAILFFRMGDFYEAFYEDAQIAARELDLTLTKRQDIPMSGVPHHTCEGYIDRLVSKGYRVAVAEQMEDPKQVRGSANAGPAYKGLVKREVVRVVTPGTLINSSLLSDKTNNFVAAMTRVGQIMGLAVLDLTTAEFRVIEVENEKALLNEIHRVRPSELVVPSKIQDKYRAFFDDLQKHYQCLISIHEDWRFEHQTAHDFLTAHLGVKTLDGYGLRGMVAAINAAGGLLSYIQDVLCHSVDHVRGICVYASSQYMAIDRATWRHLELTESQGEFSKRNTLLNILDKTGTPMGARLLHQWVKQPLLDPVKISGRQEGIQALCMHGQILEELSNLLHQVRDLERLIMKVCSGYASPRDLIALRHSFEPVPAIKELLQKHLSASSMIREEEMCMESLPAMTRLIEAALVDEPPLRLSDGRAFRDGYCKELDELYEISRDAKSWLSRYQSELREATGIKTLKVGFNKMFGYFIEVSKGQAEKMPERFQRRQTLVNAERFITPELKDYENKVMHAEERIASIENGLFVELRMEIAKYGPGVQKTAQALAKIDVLQSLAQAARKYDYVRPVVDGSSQIRIEAGRHPVIEAASTIAERFIPNDTLMDETDHRLLLITGPNMAGKSTYIRQVALIVIMAQIGSFVPASHAHIGIVDKVFSRIGASDDLSRGQSTFMVEMTETANILNNATSKSLVILDEIGRGTSTYDGISIAWSVAEYLLITEGKMAKTLFATHYWELTRLESKIPGAVNYNVAVHETEGEIIFLRKIVKGGTDKSYGIHVARLAGLPEAVVSRAKEILIHLEENANRKSAFEPVPAKKIIATKQRNRQHADNNMQMTFFG